MRGPLTIGVDLGGTNFAAGLVDADGQLLTCDRASARVGDYDAALEEIEGLVGALRAEADRLGEPAKGIGLAVAAFLDAGRTHVVHAANLDWHDRPLLADLRARIGLPIRLANDADAAAWGEHVHGGRAPQPSLALITVGTGVGCGIVLHGRLLTGASGLGGELGHIPVVRDGRPCPCGARGCLEQYASGTALRRAARDGAYERPADAAQLLALVDGERAAIDGPHVLAAARAGDPVAKAALDEVGGWLGMAVAHVVGVLDPAVVLLGGGLAAAGELLLGPVRAAYANHVGIPKLHADQPVELAHLGGRAGVVGAAALARS